MTAKTSAAVVVVAVVLPWIALGQLPRPKTTGRAAIEYFFEQPACVTHPVSGRGLTADQQRAAGFIRWCVDRIVVSGERMTVHFTRELSEFSDAELAYGSDEGNRNMYLRDDRGQRYDSIATNGAARTGGKLDRQTRLEGAFVFRAPAAGVRTFTFFDDDDHLKIEGLRLDPALVVDPAWRQSLHTVLAAADRIHFRDNWAGDAPPGTVPVVEYALQKAGERWTGTVTFSVGQRTKSMVWRPDAKTMSRFFDAMEKSALTTAKYVPKITHTDDYPHLQLEIDAGSRRAVVHSESQGVDHVPWAVDIDGRTYTVPTADPARALTVLLDSADANEARRLLDELKR